MVDLVGDLGGGRWELEGGDEGFEGSGRACHEGCCGGKFGLRGFTDSAVVLEKSLEEAAHGACCGRMGETHVGSISSLALVVLLARGFFSFSSSPDVMSATAAFLTGEAADATRL